MIMSLLEECWLIMVFKVMWNIWDLSLIMVIYFLLFKLVKILFNLENINGMVVKIYFY